jgi:isopenicillin N synthase-like dioxygenase
MENENLHILDISNLSFDDVERVKKLVDKLSEVCETSGFFYLKIEDKFGRHCVDMLDAAK